MRISFTIIGILLSGFLFSQRFSSDLFHEGFLVSTKKDTLQGSVKYDLSLNSISVIREGKIKSFSAQKIAYFEFYDRLQNNYRRFYSIPYKVNIGYKTPIFFEVLYEGKISLLTREQIVQRTVNSTSPYWGGAAYTQTIVEYSFYFLNDRGQISFFSGRKKELLSMFPKKSQYMKDYIKDNKLRVDDRADLIRIMAFYNSI